MRFHPNNFSEYFRQTTKNGSKGAFSVLSPFVVFVLFLSSSFLVLRWLWPRMLVVPKPKLFVFLGLLAWFAVSVTLRCFFCNLLGTMVFLFHADNNVSEFFRHTTQNGSKGAFSVLLRKVWLKGFRTVHNMVGSGGPKCLCGRWLSSLRSQDLARQWQAWPDGPDGESLSMPVLLVCVGDRVFLFFGPSLSCASLQEWEHIKWRQHGRLRYWTLCLECDRHVWGTDGRTSTGPAACRAPGYRPKNSLSGNPPEEAPCSHFCFPCSTMGSPTGNLFRVCTNEIQLSLEDPIKITHQ